MKSIAQLLINALAVVLIAKLLPGVVVANLGVAIWVAFLLSILNLLLRPILILLTLPITVLTFGLFLLAVNAMIICVADNLVAGFSVSSFWVAIWFSILLAVLESILSSFFGVKSKKS